MRGETGAGKEGQGSREKRQKSRGGKRRLLEERRG